MNKIQKTDSFFFLVSGIKYGNIALKLIIVYIIRHYRILTKACLKDLKFRMNVTLCLVNDNIFEVVNREVY